ncbi:MAG: hypothetical protein A2V81_02280 [Candidatus Abawacabacteria bacterium RBG_16_42_10]|uniref:Uncharacterized protein n=1 Tax=Candidatus Abawacabacteria bacterium RBG_16_42_10 TaxID=1817814 RepID=A0A1F4XKX7_9BACT|nr:MAG: hypothetical protein A2V81_02280 [Candidatus Abawacabacteria bacterium RBG_16_42_10]
MPLPEDSMAHFISASRAKPDRNFVKRLENQLLGEKEHTLQRALLWLTVPAFATTALLVGTLYQSSQVRDPIDNDVVLLNQIEAELGSLDQETLTALDQMQSQLEIQE